MFDIKVSTFLDQKKKKKIVYKAIQNFSSWFN